MSIDKRLSGLAWEINIIRASYKGEESFGIIQNNRKPKDIDHVISDLLEIKNAWIEENKNPLDIS